MTKSILKFKPVAKDQLFYNRYQYCFGFRLAEASALRGLSHAEINRSLDQRVEWRNLAHSRWPMTMRHSVGNEITPGVRSDLHTVCELLADRDCKLVVSSNTGHVYTNDLELIDNLVKLRCLTNKIYTKAVVNRPKNIVLLKNSPYTSRSYFNTIKLNPQEKENIKNFFLNQKEHVRTSPSFYKWLTTKPYLRLMDYYFIDYTGEQWLTMLSLIRPGLIRRTMQIVTK